MRNRTFVCAVLVSLVGSGALVVGQDRTWGRVPTSPSLSGLQGVVAAAQGGAVPTTLLLSRPEGTAAAAQARAGLRVPGDYGTIQAAVDAASPGDRIDVAPGVYCERVTIVGKSDVRLQSRPGHPAVITGECLGKTGTGIQVTNASGVEITGFVVEYFELGIRLTSVTDARIHQNEARFNRGSKPGTSGVGILLQNSNASTVAQNTLHGNGRNGIFLSGSSGNIVRGNRLTDNNVDNTPGSPCNLMMAAGSNENAIVENEVVGRFGLGIMLGPGVATGNRVEQNRIHGFPGPGILAMSSAAANFVEQNDARDNGTGTIRPDYGAPGVDLLDQTQPPDNAWNRNLGRCGGGTCERGSQ